MAVVAASGLSERYGAVTAVDGVGLRVDAGEIYALLGLNGAGKTTTIRMLLGMIRPTAGSVALFGVPVGPARRSVWARVGYLVETPAAYPELTVGGSIFFGLIVIWIFGREFSDRTIKDLLALPTPRATVVAAKFAVIGGWCLLLAMQTYLLGLAIGAALGLPGWSVGTAVRSLAVLLTTAAMTVLLVTPLALAASIGRGYLAAVGC